MKQPTQKFVWGAVVTTAALLLAASDRAPSPAVLLIDTFRTSASGVSGEPPRTQIETSGEQR